MFNGNLISSQLWKIWDTFMNDVHLQYWKCSDSFSWTAKDCSITTDKDFYEGRLALAHFYGSIMDWFCEKFPSFLNLRFHSCHFFLFLFLKHGKFLNFLQFNFVFFLSSLSTRLGHDIKTSCRRREKNRYKMRRKEDREQRKENLKIMRYKWHPWWDEILLPLVTIWFTWLCFWNTEIKSSILTCLCFTWIEKLVGLKNIIEKINLLIAKL